MKKIPILLFLIFSVLFQVNAQEKKSVVATASMISDMAKNIGGDLFDIQCIVPIGGDPHLYDPRPSDATMVHKADLVFKNGLTFEGWLNELIETSGTTAEIVTVTETVVPVASTEYANATDPHAWMDAKNGLRYIKSIRDAFVRLSPEQEAAIEENYQRYAQEIRELDRYIREQIKKIPEKQRVLITSHDAFQYYGRAYGVRLEAVMGTSTDAEVQTSDITRLYQVIEESKVPAIFVESTINPKLLKQVAADNDIIIGGELYADSIGDEDSPAPSYISMLRHNTDVLVAALSSKGIHQKEEAGAKEGAFWKKALLFGLIALLFIGGFWLMLSRLNRNAENQDHLTDPSKEATISIKGLSVSYDHKVVLSNIYLEMESGKIWGVIGPNGAGKSTLFKAILGLTEVSAGNVLVEGLPIESKRKEVVYVPQKTEVDWSFPATVFDIVLMGRYPHKKAFQAVHEKDQQLAMDALIEVGMEAFKDRQIGELSGGQQQRVFIARALCQEADIFLLDEPFVGVDMTTEEHIIKILKKLAAKGKTLLVVHHDLSSVVAYFDKVILLNQRLIAYGDTESTFIESNIAKAYGGQLPILHQTGRLVK